MYPKNPICPTCGKRKMRLVRSDWIEMSGRRKLTVHALPRLECANCGEVLLDRESMHVIESARRARRVARAG